MFVISSEDGNFSLHLVGKNILSSNIFQDVSTRWTDRQHSLYIRSLEASFVNELHRSMHLRCRSIKNSTHNMPKQVRHNFKDHVCSVDKC